jgi:pimeloyl-ACP methyl ester carboxylesterase
LCRYGFSNPERIPDEAVEVFTTCAQQYGAEHSILNLLSGRFTLNLEERLSMLAHPVTLIWADKAIFPPLEWAYRLQSEIGNSSLVILQDTGVLAALESPAEVVQVLKDDLQGELRFFRAG